MAEVVGLVAAVVQLIKFTREVHHELSSAQGLHRQYRTWTAKLRICLSLIEQLTQPNLICNLNNDTFCEILQQCKDEIVALLSLLDRYYGKVGAIRKFKGAVKLLVRNKEISERVSSIQELAKALQAIVNQEEMRHIRLHLIQISGSMHSPSYDRVIVPASRDTPQISLATYSVHVTVYREQLTEFLQHQSRLAFCLEEQKRFAEAKDIHEQALLTKQAVFGRRAPETLSTINSLGICLDGLGQYELARAYILEAWSERQHVLPKGHPDLLKSLFSLANTYYREGDFSKARTMHRECLEQRIRSFGELHIDTMRSKSNLAIIDYEQNRCAAAEKQLRPLIANFGAELGADHAESIRALMNVAKVVRCLRRFAESESLMRTALTNARMTRDESEPIVVDILHSLCLLLRMQGQIAEALDISVRVKEGRVQIYGLCHIRTQLSIIPVTQLEQRLLSNSE